VTKGVIIRVRITPRSSRDAIDDVDEQGALRIRVTAPPAEGAANAAVVRSLAKVLGVPRGAVSIVSGARGRHKRIRIEGADVAVLRAHWPDLVIGSDG
jgi:uncharacterized protein